VQDTWTTAARNVGALTAAYLSPSELVDVWNSIKSMPCYGAASGEPKAWADLLEAVAARNAAEILRRGTPLLEQANSLSRDELTYLTTVMAAAHIRMGQASQARRLLAAQWGGLDHQGEFSLSLRELHALAQAREEQTVAQAAAGVHGEVRAGTGL
jgi:hypothetical protein